MKAGLIGFKEANISTQASVETGLYHIKVDKLDISKKFVLIKFINANIFKKNSPDFAYVLTEELWNLTFPLFKTISFHDPALKSRGRFKNL